MKKFFNFYLFAGVLTLFGLGAAHYNGWALTPTDKAIGIPKNVRDNPGAYRTHYIGGK